MNHDQQHVKDIITETIRLLCRTGLQYRHCLRIQGLLGVTVDDNQIVLIHMNDSISAASSTALGTHLNHSSKLPNLSSEVRDSDSSTISQNSAVSDPAGRVPFTTGKQSDTGQCVEQAKVTNVSSGNSACDGNASIISDGIAHTCFSDTLDPSNGNIDEQHIGTGSDFRCTFVKNNVLCAHTDGYLTTIPTIEVVSEDCKDSNTAPEELGGVSLLQPNLLPTDDPAFLVTAYCGNEINRHEINRNEMNHVLSAKVLCLGDPSVKTVDGDNVFTAKTPSSTSCNIVDMSTDVHEEQVVADEMVMASGSLDGNNSYMQPSASESTSMIKMDQVSKPVEHEMVSDNSYSDESDDDNDSDTSESNCQSTQSQQGSFEPMPGVPQWSSSLQRSLSDSYSVVGGAAWNLSPGILGSVIPTGGPHSAAYYQQQILAAAAAAAHNRAARAAAVVKTETTDTASTSSHHGHELKHLSAAKVNLKCEKSPSSRRLPRRPRESEEKRFRCPFCELAYYHKKHLKYHLAKKHAM